MIDPVAPMKDYVYDVVRVSVGDQDGSSFQLVRPGTPVGSRQKFIVNSVFTVKIK